MSSLDYTSLKFKFIENNMDKILNLIINNQKIARYIKYLDNDPLNTNKPDVNITPITDIILTPFDINVLTDEAVKLFFSFYRTRFNDPVGEITYYLDIVVPLRYWLLQGQGKIRAFRIADEIALMIDHKHVAGIGKVIIDNPQVFAVNANYGGLHLEIIVTNLTISGG